MTGRPWLVLVFWLALVTPVAAEEPVSKPERNAILRRARVWLPPPVPLERMNLSGNPTGAGSFDADATVECRFQANGVGGSTPKFECRLPDGVDVKVKYGRDNPEVFAEVIASRLLAALGFPADRMYVVHQVRCAGCPPNPFAALQCLNDGTPKSVCFPRIDYSTVRTFDDAVIERPMRGRRIELRRDRGWRWDELGTIDPQVGGAPPAHVDALRLMAVFLNHWDNKSKNQRLICRDSADTRGLPPGGSESAEQASGVDGTGCEQPLAMVQDLGDAFGPFKLDLDGWRATPVWADAAACRVSMRTLPYGGSTFPDVVISEAGRAFLASRLRAFTPDRVRAVLTGARLERYRPAVGRAAGLDEWVEAFGEKVRAIVDRPACPQR